MRQYEKNFTTRYLFGGKEKQIVGDINYMDYINRMYDSDIGRWFVQYLLLEKYPSLSSYAFCGNNPINRIDPNGMDWFVNNENGNVFFIRGLSDLTKIDDLNADWLTKNGIDI
ncbi:MAG: hypothetical protein LBJ63_03095, partial [Prevotellaceae bacterium]|nr:hypothetical protein [Prevotellaceae bacterium]